MHQVKICLWKCTQQQLRSYTPKRKRRHCDETTITGCTGSYHFDNLQWIRSTDCAELLDCLSDMAGTTCSLYLDKNMIDISDQITILHDNICKINCLPWLRRRYTSRSYWPSLGSDRCPWMTRTWAAWRTPHWTLWSPVRNISRHEQNGRYFASGISMASWSKGPTRHAYAWQIGSFWQDTHDIWICMNLKCDSNENYDITKHKNYKSDVKRRNTLSCLDQHTCRSLSLWNSGDCEAI